jgi:hypothetical protein
MLELTVTHDDTSERERERLGREGRSRDWGSTVEARGLAELLGGRSMDERKGRRLSCDVDRVLTAAAAVWLSSALPLSPLHWPGTSDRETAVSTLFDHVAAPATKRRRRRGGGNERSMGRSLMRGWDTRATPQHSPSTMENDDEVQAEV